MKCFYTTDPKTLKKVLIPMCMSVVESGDIRDCNCSEPLTEYHFEKERFNKVVIEKNKTIESLQAEVLHLNKIISKLNKK